MQPGTYRIIPVKAKKRTVFALVSPEDYDALARFNWFNNKGYAVRNAGGRVDQHRRSMHREILGLTRGDGLEGDHINRDPLDNRRENLRIVTHARNGCNVPSQGGTSKYRGVTWQRRATKWQASAMYGGKDYYLGLHVAEDDAARAVNAFWVARGCEAPNDLSS